MKIKGHRLFHNDDSEYLYRESPNRGGTLTPEFLVIHYTAGRSAEKSVNWLTNKKAKASAHLVIGRDGEITQLVPFNRVAHHAGQSTWAGRDGLNQYSIGIELDNPGHLKRTGDKWRAYFGREYPNDEVLEATHKHETKPRGWLIFPEAQIDALLEVASLLIDKYDLRDVVGHDDIAPNRKLDPGPAFPMAHVRARLLGRAAEDSGQHRTTDTLNIRSGAGTQHATLDAGPLPKGTPVLVLRSEGNWRFVDVLASVNGAMDLEGWVHGRFLEETT